LSANRLLDQQDIRLLAIPMSQPIHHSGVRVKSNDTRIQFGPGTNAVAKVRADVEAQVTRADERGIDPCQGLVVEGQSIINKKGPGETKSSLD
jgi:hypothetical protein